MMLAANLRYCLGAVVLSALACQAFASNEGEQPSGGFASPPFPQRGPAPGISPSLPGRAGDPIGGSSGSGNGGGSNGGAGGRAGAGGQLLNPDDRDADVPDAEVPDADAPDAPSELDAASE